MTLLNRILTPALAGLLLSGAALAADAPTLPAARDGVLADAAGMTVYTFDKDAADSGKSVCNGACADNWPPLAAPADAGPLAAPYSVVLRDDGSRQLAYQGKPLYRFKGDSKAGQRSGDDLKQVWHVVKQ